jgi:fibrillarin-like pre-rRNA processing protein
VRQAARARPFPGSPRLFSRAAERGLDLWSETVGALPPVYGERWTSDGDRTLREFNAGRSKLAAGIVRGWRQPLPTVGERWLYLGAASGTTASHVADLVGPIGAVYAVERSPRTFARLLALARRWPNLLPILADARDPSSYGDLVPEVDGLYADVAQPDQIALVRANAELFLRGAGAAVVIALKTASLGRELTPSAHLARAERQLADQVRLEPSVRLDPIHRAHYLVGGAWLEGTPTPGTRAVTTRRGPTRGRRRR